MAHQTGTCATTGSKDGGSFKTSTLSLAELHSQSSDEGTRGSNEGTTTRDSAQQTSDKGANAHKPDLKKLLKNPMCWGRIVTLILALMLLLLSGAYCIAQELRVELQLLTTCDSPKEQEEIWEHSYRSGLQADGEVVMNEQSQYGHTEEACWTTKSMEWDTDQIWFSNHYVYRWRDPFVFNVKFLLYLLMSLFILIFAVYDTRSMVSDFNALRNGKLHEKCPKFEQFELNTPSGPLEHETVSHRFHRIYNRIETVYWKYCGYDTTGWVLSSILSGFLELFIQTRAILIYNGFDESIAFEKSLAMKPGYILLFSCILCLNAVATGLSWLGYAW